MAKFFIRNIIFVVVCIISALLLANTLLTHRNNTILEQNRALQLETQRVKLEVLYLADIIRFLDIGLRGYVISRDSIFTKTMNNAKKDSPKFLNALEASLKNQNFDFPEFYHLKDSLGQYIVYCFQLKELINHDYNAFLTQFKTDRGLPIWLLYMRCKNKIDNHEHELMRIAEARYHAALKRNANLQIALFILCIPTLLYTAFQTRKTFKLSEMLRQAVADQNNLLQEQNTKLEYLVNVRTQEIAAQNEEIVSQNEEIAAQRNELIVQNTNLHNAHKVIENQNEEITVKNKQLSHDVDVRTYELQNANKELVQQNHQLEQFAFIAAHNLRAPLARILGLANLLDFLKDPKESESVIQRMITSTKDLDVVIHDLNTILDIQKHSSNLVEVNLPEALQRVRKILEHELNNSDTTLIIDFEAVETVSAVSPYVDSMLYNLISNAIKYRNPVRTPCITIRTDRQPPFIVLKVSDNGLGIDLEKYKENLFGLYKRFHLHTEGRGIGLYLIKTQITALGGRVEVESKPNEGTMFALYFKE